MVAEQLTLLTDQYSDNIYYDNYTEENLNKFLNGDFSVSPIRKPTMKNEILHNLETLLEGSLS